MVAIAPPPPTQPPQPELYKVQVGTHLLRIYNPTKHGAGPLTFRHFGPLSRFDHQRDAGRPADDADRGILYAGPNLRSCLVEIFGDERVVRVGEYEVAQLTVTRELVFLDLRAGNAMKAGTVAGVCKDSDRKYSQAWSRFFYETGYTYGALDGLVWGNAHNDEDAFALYERSSNALACDASSTCALSDNALRTEVLLSAAETNMFVWPY